MDLYGVVNFLPEALGRSLSVAGSFSYSLTWTFRRQVLFAFMCFQLLVCVVWIAGISAVGIGNQELFTGGADGSMCIWSQPGAIEGTGRNAMASNLIASDRS